MPKFVVSTGTRVFTRSLSATGGLNGEAQMAGLRFRWVPGSGGPPPSGGGIGDIGGGGGGSSSVQLQYSLTEGGTWINTAGPSAGSIIETYTVRHIVEITYPPATGTTVRCYDEWSTRQYEVFVGSGRVVNTTESAVGGWSYLSPGGAIGIGVSASGAAGSDASTSASGTWSGFAVYPLSVGPNTTTESNGHGCTITKTSAASTSSAGASVSASVSLTGVAASTTAGYPVGAYGAAADAIRMRPNIPIGADFEVRQLEKAFNGALDAQLQFKNPTTGAVVTTTAWQALTAGTGTITASDHSAEVYCEGASQISSTPHLPIRPVYRETNTEGTGYNIFSAYAMSDEDTGFTLTYGGGETVDNGSSLTPTGNWAASWRGFAKKALETGEWGTSSGLILDGSVSTTGTEIVATVPHDPGSPSLGTDHYAFLARIGSALPGTSGMLGWTKLRFKIKCNAPTHQVRFQVALDNTNFDPAWRANKWWFFNTGASDTWKTVEIDLSAEHTKNPFSIADYHDYVDAIWGVGPYYGTTSRTMVWSGLQWGQVYRIKDIELVAPSNMRAHLMMDSFVEPEVGSPNPGPRALIVEGDGQHILDGFVRWADTFNVSGAIDRINARRPWSAAGASPPSAVGGVYDISEIFNPLLMPARMIGGGGEGWHHGDNSLGIITGLETEIPVQWRCDCIWWDWDDSPTGPFPSPGSIDARAVHVLRNAPWGKVLNEDAEVAPGVEVHLYRPSDGVDLTETSDLTDGAGDYICHAPNITRPAALGVKCNNMVVPSGWIQTMGRHRLVIRAMVIEPKSWLSLDTHPSGLTAFATTVDGALELGLSTNWVTNAWQEKKAFLPMAQPCVRFLLGSAQGRAGVAYLTDTGASQWIYSDDLGDSWSEPKTLWASDRTRIALASHPAGWQMAVSRSSSGALAGKWLDMLGNVVAGPFTAVDSGVGDDCIALVFDADAQLWKLSYVTSGGALVERRSSDGVTWGDAATLWASGSGKAASDSSDSGYELVASRTSAGAILIKWVDRFGNVLHGPFTALASGARNDSLGLSWDNPAKRWYLTYLDESGVLHRLESSDGVTWS